MISCRSLIAPVLAGCLSMPAWGADQYWYYADKDIEVTATGGADRAKDIAHNLHRLDRAIGIMLGLHADEWRPPARVYAVPQATFDLLSKKSSGFSSIYYSHEFSSDILINISLDRDMPYFDAYLGYAGGVLTNAYPFRFPYWYRVGFAQVFAASEMTHNQVTLGGFVVGRIRPLIQNGWIPIKTLLSIQYNDPQRSSGEFESRYEAECWFVAHQVMIEQMHHESFLAYFSRLDAGEDESHAFSASFPISYEDLDKELHTALTRGVVKIFNLKIPDELDSTVTRRLTDSEAKGRLAEFAATHAVQTDGAVELTNQALAADPENEYALIAIANVHLRQRDLPAALQAAQRLCVLDPLSSNAARQCASIYAQLLQEGAAKNPALGLDAPALAEQSRKHYETALRLDSEDLAAWSGMAALLTKMRDVEYAKSFLPGAKHAWAMHSHDESLSRSLSGLCATTGDYDTAIKFAEVWQKYALTGASSVAAEAYLSRLRTWAQQKQLTDAPERAAEPATAGTPP